MSSPISVWDFVDSVSNTKKELVKTSHDPETVEKGIDTFIMTRALSLHQDSILFANEMNEFWMLPKDAVYRYYLNTLRPRKRYAKWNKTAKDAEIEAICQVYNVNRIHAAQYYDIMSEEQRKAVVAKTDKGGTRK